MSKVDFKRELNNFYNAPKKEFVLVDVPEMAFLMVDGQGDPNRAPAYTEAVEALYGVAYPLKFLSKKALGRDYVVPPLEGLWWADDMDSFTVEGRRDDWKWTMMIMTPDWITEEMVAQTVGEVHEKKDLPALPLLRLERYHEGPSLQILHIGSYADEAPTLQWLYSEVMPAQGFQPAGRHHEIYLSDPRRVTPAKLKTILRQPVKKGREGTG